MRSKSVLVYRNEAFCNHSDAYKRQIQRVGTSGLEIRVQGRALVFFLPAFFQRKPGPRPEPGGHALETVLGNVRAVMRTGKVLAFSCFCVDFDKYAQGGETTFESGRQIIEAGLAAWAET